MNLSVTRTIGGYTVKPGVRIPFASNQQTLSFSFATVLDSEAPDQWHGEVMFAGRVVISTASFDTDLQAGRAAEQALVKRFQDLLTGDAVATALTRQFLPASI